MQQGWRKREENPMTRFIRMMLRLLPRGFRDRHAIDLVKLYHDSYLMSGRFRRIRFYVRVIGDVVITSLLDLAHIDAVPVRSRNHRPAHVQHGWPVLGCCVFGGKLCAGPTDHEGESSGGAESGVKRGFLNTVSPLSL